MPRLLQPANAHTRASLGTIAEDIFISHHVFARLLSGTLRQAAQSINSHAPRMISVGPREVLGAPGRYRVATKPFGWPLTMMGDDVSVLISFAVMLH